MARAYWLCIGLVFLAVLLSISLGSVPIAPGTLLNILIARLPGMHLPVTWPDSAEVIVFQLRLPRTVLVALTGAALAGSGASYQGLFRNPLADPYLIGVASGGGLGAVIAMAIHWPNGWLSLAAVPAAAFAAALLTVVLVYTLARVGRSVPTTNLILAGVAVSSFATALTSFLMLRSQDDLHRALAWLLGGGSVAGWDPVLAMLPYVALGLGLQVILGHPLNVLQFGEEQAHQLGLSVEKVRLVVVAAASLTTAAAVAFAGIIGFIGLVVPHLVRMLWTSDYRHLIPLSILGGASMLLLADLAARTVLAPQELPVGIITALAGAPFFLWVLRRAKQQSFW